ncbi:Eco57I restriction-modification methylase domain-containing protein [Allisonella histaminiformans]|uniref:Eco57I restriction-modification methylase domain-containing protein n=1 Tax=Allisonella histaminiformans TaxID=209880 RepID=UPI002E77EF52|nr:Eco57I restriction-modification methylase domain-containing protein [Allisonella histaminiformans]
METNFQFLTKNEDTGKYYVSCKEVESLYADGHYQSEVVTIRTICENLVKDIMDQEYMDVEERATFNDNLRRLKHGNYIKNEDVLEDLYEIKGDGNSGAHEITSVGKVTGLDNLKKLLHIMSYFARHYYEIKTDITSFIEPIRTTYATSERKLIYIQTVDQKKRPIPYYRGLEKIGDASIADMEADLKKNSPDLNAAANARIRQYMKTANLPYVLQWTELAYRQSDRSWFRDKDVHAILERSNIKRRDMDVGQEWFPVTLETAKRAIQAYKDGKTALEQEEVVPQDQRQKKEKIVLRKEQQDAVDQTIKAFKDYDEMLWNAKMRFGKTLTALALIKKKKFKKVLIMTHRPVVNEGWFEDFNKCGMNEAGYLYGSKRNGHKSVKELEDSGKKYVYFASIQDLRGSTCVGGKVGDKNEDLFHTKWDLVIIDEAHEGTQTDLAQNVIDVVRKNKKHCKLLELSGTPFNLLNDYEDDQVFTWDYTMEQEAKARFSEEHPDEKNPYQGLPKVSMYTFEMNRQFKNPEFSLDSYDKRSFNFKEFFRTDEQGNFAHEDSVRSFLKNITTSGDTNYPFSTPQFRNNLRHTLWILPGIKECNALEDLLNEEDSVFHKEGYKIINVVRGDTSDELEASDSDVQRVKNAMEPDPAKTKTITLTVRKLTTGVTIRPWTGVLFLSNMTSAMQYLQAAFRAQTTYSSETFGEKTNCYIFDFAPDRALTVMAEASSLSTGVGRVNKKGQREKMSKLLNFLPIIGEQGHRMQPFNVDSLLAKVKRVYAEKAVRSGFDDDSIYSDKLLMLKEGDLSAFNQLKAIVGQTQREKRPVTIDVNHQGLTNEEYETYGKGKRKPKKQRTKEEQEAIEKVKELRKQRRTMISILRGISIRIPMMIYGMDIQFDKEVSIRNFVNSIDDISWVEFMPKGVTKELFKQFIPYYDADVFIEAGKIIRQRVKELDKADPLDRVEKMAAIFGTFKNPDKETVLTPWRVVNMHIGKTLGGLVYYDKEFKNTTQDGVSAQNWMTTEYTDRVYSERTHILEINAKTGLYPLFVAASLYYKEFMAMNDRTGGRFSILDEQQIWKRILRENIFIIAKTPMARIIAMRTLRGYHTDWPVNAEYVENIVDDTKLDVEKEAEKIERLFGYMKFDVVIGNPPYQQEGKGDNARAEPIYHDFMELSYKLSDLTTLITPGRFLFNAGQTPKAWNDKMLSDTHLKIVMYEQNSGKIFPRTDIKGGVVITLRDVKQEFEPIGVFTAFKELNEIIKKVEPSLKSGNFSSLVSSRGNFRFSDKFFRDFPNASNKLGKGSGNMIVSNAFEKLPSVFVDDASISQGYLKLLGRLNGRRKYKYIKREYVLDNEYIDCYKVMIPEANGSGAIGEVLSTPLIGATDTFICVGPFKDNMTAENVLKYVKTKFSRTMLGVKKATQHM